MGLLRFLILTLALAASPLLAEPLETSGKDWVGDLRKEATGNILPFWLEHARNPSTGGLYGQVGGDLKPRPSEPRGSLLTSRVLWTFSAAYRLSPKSEYKEMATYALRDLLDHFWDAEHGGVYWSIAADGAPKETEKQVYAQAFAVYGLTEYARVFGNDEARDRALQLYRLMEKHTHEPVHGGYVETCGRDWTRLRPKGRALMGPAADKSQNTNLHVMEAWTNLLRLWPDDGLRESQKRLIQVMTARILDQSTGHLHLFQKDDWTPLSHEYSYGHDIEFSWLLTEAAEVLGDEAILTDARRIALQIADVTAREGMDEDGGIFHEGKAGKVTARAKEWWPQAEALVGFINAYQLSGDTKYRTLAERSWAFIQARQIDHRGGEWFLYAPESEARASRMPKISFWKCCYHNTRACLEAADRLEALAKAR